MKRPARPFLGLAVLAASLLGASLPRAAGQPPAPRVPPNGSHAFRIILHGSGLKPLKEIADLDEDAAKKLLIVFGDPGVLEGIDLKGFLDQGGAVLVATDRGESPGANRLLRTFGVFPLPGVVRSRTPESGYQGQPYCPYAVTAEKDHPLFRGVKQLATNKPTAFLIGNNSLPVLARFPQRLTLFEESFGDARIGRPRMGPWIGGLYPYAAGMGGPDGGRVLILAGHGVFLNGMMANRDNIFFTRNCIDWFTRPKGTLTRDQVLFIEEGRVVSQFDVPLVELPAPPLPAVQELNDLLRGLEDENFFNEFVLRMLGPRNRIFTGLVILASAVLILYGLRRFWRARHWVELKVPLVAPEVGRTVPTDHLVVQRHRDMLRAGNLWEAARDLARQCFAAYAGRSVAHPPPRPEFRVKGGWWRRRALAQQAQRLWELAYESPARPVSRAQFSRLAAEVDQVKAALASGDLSFQEPPPLARPLPVRQPAPP
jgi:hypothetical protein